MTKLLIILALLGGIAYGMFNSGRLSQAKEEECSPKECLLTIATRVRAQKEARKSRAELSGRVQKVKDYFAKNRSPLEPYAEAFVLCADRYGLPTGLLVGITRVESSLGKNYSLTNNPFNYGIYLGMSFDSIPDATCHVARKLKENYDTTSPYTIAVKYAPAADRNNPSHWAGVVTETIALVN